MCNFSQYPHTPVLENGQFLRMTRSVDNFPKDKKAAFGTEFWLLEQFIMPHKTEMSQSTQELNFCNAYSRSSDGIFHHDGGKEIDQFGFCSKAIKSQLMPHIWEFELNIVLKHMKE